MVSTVLVLVLAGVAAGLLASRPTDQTQRVAELELQLRAAEERIAALQAEAAKQKAVAIVRPSTSPKSDRDEPQQSAAAAKSSSRENFPESMAKMYNDPKMRETMKAQQLMAIEMQYSKLITNLQLDEKETSHFKSLLSDRLTDKTELGFKLMDKALPQPERSALMESYQFKKKASDEAIRTFLNSEEDYNTFQHWEDTEQERMQMLMGRTAFDGAGVPLSAQQEQQLIDLMAEVRKRPSDVPNWSDPTSIDPLKMDAQASAIIMNQLKAQHEAVRNSAAAFLSAEQLAALAKMHEQLLTMTETGLKMSRAMMGVDE
jgi:hypothetical protein